MTENAVEEAIKTLNNLAEYKAKLDLLTLSMTGEINVAMPEEVREAIQEIKNRYLPDIEKATLEIEMITQYVQGLVLELQTTIKADFLMAVYSPGRVTWNGKELAGFFKTMPELGEKFSKKGEASVTIRRI